MQILDLNWTVAHVVFTSCIVCYSLVLMPMLCTKILGASLITIADVDHWIDVIAGHTPLLWSASNGQRAAYELLIQFGIIVQVKLCI